MHVARVPSHDEVLQTFRKAGYSTLTPFQEKLLPQILRGKDVAAGVRAGSGATSGFLVPVMLGLRGAGPAPRAIIMVATTEEVGKVTRVFTRFTRAMRDAPAFVPLGEIEDARREQRRLEKGATIVAGTVERVIDHIRRGSLPLGELETVVIREPDSGTRPDFVKDVQFIFAKLPERRQTILFSQAPPTEENELMQLLRHPVAIDAEAPVRPDSVSVGHLFYTVDTGERTQLLARVMFGLRIRSALVYHAPRSDAMRIVEGLSASGLRAARLAQGGDGSGARPHADRRDAIQAFSRGAIDALLLPLAQGGQAAPELADLAPSHVLFLDLPAGSSRPGVSAARRGAIIVAFVERGQERELSRLQEAIGVSIERRDKPGDDEVLTGAIDRVLRVMKEDDPVELARLRSRIRRQVPVLQRALFMASLLKSQLPGFTGGAVRAPSGPVPRQPPTPAGSPLPPKGQRGRFGKSRDGGGPVGGKALRGGEPQRPAKPDAHKEGEYTQLFVSIGRNRRVFARDLQQLFAEKVALASGDIGGVRVFEKYSFVDIVPGKAGEAIAKLSGTELKGRTITVNYAKKKEEKEQR